MVTFTEQGAQEGRQVWEGEKLSPRREVQEIAGGGGLEFRPWAGVKVGTWQRSAFGVKPLEPREWTSTLRASI